MNIVTKEDLLEANRYGLSHRDDVVSSFTPLLETACELGQKGIDLSNLKVVTGYRYGEASQSGKSYNFRDDYPEAGLSMAKLEEEEECYSSVYFAHKNKHTYTGFLLKEKGSDGESLIIPFGKEFINCGF